MDESKSPIKEVIIEKGLPIHSEIKACDKKSDINIKNRLEEKSRIPRNRKLKQKLKGFSCNCPKKAEIKKVRRNADFFVNVLKGNFLMSAKRIILLKLSIP